METQTLPPPENQPPPPPPAAIDYSSNVDTSRAFRSVKEAVAIFGERFLTREMIFLPSSNNKPPFCTLSKKETLSSKSTDSFRSSWKSCSSSCEISEQESPPSLFLVTSLKKLELELEETKNELKLLKERESETKAVLASLNAEIHKNVSKITESEKVAAEVAEKAVESGGGGRKVAEERKRMKKKPIIPLVGDLFSKKKGKSNAYILNPLYSSSQMHWI